MQLSYITTLKEYLTVPQYLKHKPLNFKQVIVVHSKI